MRRHKETEEEAVKRRQQMYGCNGKCCDRVIDPETGEGQYFICGGIDTCDETRVGEFIGMVGVMDSQFCRFIGDVQQGIAD